MASMPQTYLVKDRRCKLTFRAITMGLETDLFCYAKVGHPHDCKLILKRNSMGITDSGPKPTCSATLKWINTWETKWTNLGRGFDIGFPPACLRGME